MDLSWLGWADFNKTFLPAARHALAGIDPYAADAEFFIPPWALYPVLPLAALPELLASLIWLVLMISALLASLHLAADYFGMQSNRGRLLLIGALIITPFGLAPILSGQFTPFVMLGMVGIFVWNNPLPSLLLLSLKPHLGLLPGLFLAWKSIREGRTRQLWEGFGILAALMISSFLVVPNSARQFLDGLISARSLSIGTDYLTSSLRTFQILGLPGPVSLIIYGMVALVILVITVRRDNLAFLTTGVLLFTPYARNYDYNLILVPALYLLARRYAIPIVISLLLFPLYRLFFGSISWSWTDIVVPSLFLLLLIAQDRRKA